MRGNLLILPVNIVKGKAALFDIFFFIFLWLYLCGGILVAAALLFVNYICDAKRREAPREEV